MRKTFKITNLQRRKRGGAVAALSLGVLLAAAGCSTNKMPGSGEPTPTGPAYRPATSATTPGTSGGTVPSSGRLISSGPAGMTSPALDALTTLAEHQAYQGRILGAADPGPNPYAGMILPPTGQFISPSLTANPQLTVNSSISSEPTPVITSGADIGGTAGVFLGSAPAVVGAVGTGAGVTAAPSVNAGAIVVGSGTNTAMPVTAASSGLVATAAQANVSGPGINPVVVPSGTVVPAAPVFSAPATIATPANTANALTPGMFAAGPGVSAVPQLAPATVLGNSNTGTLTPTLSSARNPSPTIASNPPVVIGGGVSTRTGTAAVRVAGTSSAVTIGTVTSGVRGGSLSISNMSDAQAAANRAASANAPAAAPVVVGPMTSSSQGVTTSAARSRAVGTVSAVTAPVTVSGSRARTVRAASSVSAPATLGGSTRPRAVRITTAPDGAVVVTNVTDTTQRQRAVRAQ